VVCSGPAITWPGGSISGGLHVDDATGAINVGTATLSKTATGASLSVSGYIGQPPNYVYSGAEVVDGEPFTEIVANMVGDCVNGGVYRMTEPNLTTNVFQKVVVLTSPIYKGGSPPATTEIALRDTAGGVIEWETTAVGTTTVHPTQLTTEIAGRYVGRKLMALNGAAAGESQTIIDYTPCSADGLTLGVLTTDPFSVNPTDNISLVVNFNFALPLSPSQDTILNGWQWTLNGGTGSMTRVLAVPGIPLHIELIGDGVNGAAIDQEVTFSAADDGIIQVQAYGDYWIKIGSTRGAADYLNQFVNQPPIPPGEPPIFTNATYTFFGGTAVWIRIENIDTVAAGIRIVKAAQGDELLTSVRMAVLTQPIVVQQTWTELTDLEVQPDGGATLIGGDVAFDNAATWAANDTTATVLGSVGPVGAGTAVAKWLRVQDETGADLVIPAWSYTAP